MFRSSLSVAGEKQWETGQPSFLAHRPLWDTEFSWPLVPREGQQSGGLQPVALTFKETCSRSVVLAYANVLAMPMHRAIPAGRERETHSIRGSVHLGPSPRPQFCKSVKWVCYDLRCIAVGQRVKCKEPFARSAPLKGISTIINK